jgi:pimeloyl-ACP methyl ester carboxylesterase
MPFSRNPIDGVRTYYEDDGGVGAPVVVLGGFVDPVSVVRRWPLAVALSSHDDEFRMIFVDHRGHGDSDAPHDPDAYAMPLRVADVVGVLDDLNLTRSHIVGLSWGARLGFGVAEHAPERVRSLVAVGQHPYPFRHDTPLFEVVQEALDASRERGIVSVVDAFEALAGRYPEPVREAYLRGDAAAMRAAWTAAISEGAVSERLPSWRVPCLIYVAERDTDFHDDARRAADEIPSAEFVTLLDTDHLGMDTAEVDPVLAPVLRTLRRAR